MSDLDPLFPRHGNSGPAPEVTPPVDMNALWREFLSIANVDSRGLVSNTEWQKFILRRLREMAP